MLFVGVDLLSGRFLFDCLFVFFFPLFRLAFSFRFFGVKRESAFFYVGKNKPNLRPSKWETDSFGVNFLFSFVPAESAEFSLDGVPVASEKDEFFYHGNFVFSFYMYT